MRRWIILLVRIAFVLFFLWGSVAVPFFLFVFGPLPTMWSFMLSAYFVVSAWSFLKPRKRLLAHAGFAHAILVIGLVGLFIGLLGTGKYSLYAVFLLIYCGLGVFAWAVRFFLERKVAAQLALAADAPQAARR